MAIDKSTIKVPWGIKFYTQYNEIEAGKKFTLEDEYITIEVEDGEKQKIPKVFKIVGILVFPVEWEDNGERIALVIEETPMGEWRLMNYLPDNALWARKISFIESNLEKDSEEDNA